MMKTVSAVLGVVVALHALAWDVEHDEVAQLTGEFLPKEIRAQFDFDDFDTLISNCHYPDMSEWPMEGGVRRNHTLDELGEKVGPVDKEIFRSQGYACNGSWMHSERARALVMGLMARAFATGAHARAAFYVSVLTHQVADESALNHPPLLQFAQYSRYPGINLGLRKVEGGAKNVFGFRSDGYIVHRAREKLRGYVPKAPADDFESCVLEMVAASVAQGDYAARKEGLIGFGPIPEAEEALADLVAMQVRVLVDMVWTAWKFRSPDAALPGPAFDETCGKRQMAIMKALDPAQQSVFCRVFDRSLDPKDPKGIVGVVCEPYGMFAESETPYMGRMVGAMCAGTLRKAGYAVRGVSYFAAERDGLPDPKEVPTLIVFTGGTGYMCTDMSDAMAARVKAYRDAGGRLILVGGADRKDLSGFGDAIRLRPNADVPVTAKWSDKEAADALKMSVLGVKSLPRLANTRTRFVRNPSIDGFCKAVCPVEILPKPGIRPLFSLDNGRETFVVGARRGNVTWLPMYVLAQYLLEWDDPHLDYSNLTLDRYGEKVLLDVMDLFAEE